MKSKFLILLGILALALVFSFGFAACEDEEEACCTADTLRAFMTAFQSDDSAVAATADAEFAKLPKCCQEALTAGMADALAHLTDKDYVPDFGCCTDALTALSKEGK